MAIEFAERIRRIPAYPLAAGYDLGADIAMLASNESCFAASIEVLDAANRAMTGVHRYPDPSYRPLRQALADRYGIPRERIALGNGSCDILLAAGEALLEPGAEVVYAWPAFSVYPHLAAASGATAIPVALDGRDRHDLHAIAAEITVATRLVLICNPNNPTSTALGLDEIEAFLAKVPSHACVILD
jgi:histidinol-phosphate aminotransferase